MSKYDEALARVLTKGDEVFEKFTGKTIEQVQQERNAPRTPTAFDLAIKPYTEQFRPQNFPETQYHDVKSTNYSGDFGKGLIQGTMWLPDVGLYTYGKVWQGWNNIGQLIAGTPLTEVDTESNRNTVRNFLRDNVGLDFDRANSILEESKSDAYHADMSELNEAVANEKSFFGRVATAGTHAIKSPSIVSSSTGNAVGSAVGIAGIGKGLVKAGRSVWLAEPALLVGDTAKNIEQESDRNINLSDLPNIAGVGLASYGINRLGNRLGNVVTPENLATSGIVPTTRNIAISTGINAVEEGSVAGIQDALVQEAVTGEIDLNQVATQIGLEMSGGTGMTLPLATPSLIRGVGNSTKSGIDKATTTIKQKLSTPHEELINPNSKKYNPTTAYANAVAELNRADSDEARQVAQTKIDETTNSVMSVLTDFDTKIANTTNQDEIDNLTNQKQSYIDTYVTPLQNTIQSVKDNEVDVHSDEFYLNLIGSVSKRVNPVVNMPQSSINSNENVQALRQAISDKINKQQGNVVVNVASESAKRRLVDVYGENGDKEFAIDMLVYAKQSGEMTDKQIEEFLSLKDSGLNINVKDEIVNGVLNHKQQLNAHKTAPQNQAIHTSHGFTDTKVRSIKDINHKFRIPFHNLNGRSLFSGSVVKGDTLGFMALLDGDDEIFKASVGFTSITGGRHKKTTGKSHGNGYKIDLDLKNGDDVETYARIGQRVADLAKQHGYIVQVNAEKAGWGKIGKRGDVNFINGGGSHLDITVVGRVGAGQGGTVKQSQPINTDNFSINNKELTKSNLMLGTYSAFVKAGFTDGQARYLIGEVNRENEFATRYLFGTHGDKGNNKTNLGFVSWQGARKGKLVSYLNQQGIKATHSSIPQTQESLDAMARFLMTEIKQGDITYKKYKGTSYASPNFLNEPNPDRNDHKWGHSIIGWAYGQTKLATGAKFNSKDHEAKLYAGTTRINELLGSNMASLPIASEQTMNQPTTHQDELSSQALNLIRELEETNDDNTKRIQELQDELIAVQDKLANINEPEQSSQAEQTTEQAQTEPETNNLDEQVIADVRANQLANITRRFSQLVIESDTDYSKALTEINELKETGIITENEANGFMQLLDVKLRIKGNTTGEVTDQVYNGRKGNSVLETNLGIKDYATRLDLAVANNRNTDDIMANLTRFRDDHVSKAHAIREAINAFNSSPIVLAPNKNNQWQVVDNPSELPANARKYTVTTGRVTAHFQAIFDEAKDLDDFTTAWQNILNGSSTQTPNVPVAPVSNNAPVVTTPTPVQSAPVTIDTPDTAINTPESVQSAPATSNTPQVQGNIGVATSHHRMNDPNGVWVGIATDSNGNWISMSALSNPDKNITGIVDGILGNPYSTKGRGTWRVANDKEAEDKYRSLFASNYNKTPFLRDYFENLRGKTLYGRADSTEVRPLSEMLSATANMTDKQKAEYMKSLAQPQNNQAKKAVVTKNKQAKDARERAEQAQTQQVDNSNNNQEYIPEPPTEDYSDEDINLLLSELSNNENDSVTDVSKPVDVSPSNTSTHTADGNKPTTQERKETSLIEDGIKVTKQSLKDGIKDIAKGKNKLLEVVHHIPFNDDESVIAHAILKVYPDITISFDNSDADIKGELSKPKDILQSLVSKSTHQLLAVINEDTDDKQLLALKDDLDLIMTRLNQLTDLSVKESRIAQMLTQDYESLIGFGLRSKTFLSKIQTNGRAKSNLFSTLINGIKSFFGIPNKTDVSNLYERLLDVTARAIEIQAKDTRVTGKLSVLASDKQERSAEVAKPIKEQNVLKAGITQNSEANLVMVKDLVLRIRRYGMFELNRLGIKKPTAKQQEQLEHFMGFEELFKEALITSFRTKKDGYKWQDLKQFTNTGTKDNPKFDGNLMTALSHVAYDLIITNGGASTLTKRQLRSLLGVEPNALIPNHIAKKYRNLGVSINDMTSSLGRAVVRDLGLKQTDDVPDLTLARLEASLGDWLISAMQVADMVHINTLPSGEFNQDKLIAQGSDESVPETDWMKQTHFVSLSTNEINKEIADIGKGTGSYLADVLGVQSGKIYPTLKPNKEVKDKVESTSSKLSAKQKDRLLKAQQEAMVVNQDMLALVDNLRQQDSEFFYELFQARIPTDEELVNKHVSKRESSKETALGNSRDIDNFLGFVEGLPSKDTPFYDSIKTAKNSRMHYMSNVVNFQTSKIHRALVELANFKVDIDLSGFDGVTWFDDKGKPKPETLFLRAIFENAEGTEDIFKPILKDMGFDGFTVDKVPSEAFLPIAYEYLTTDIKVNNAVMAVRQLQAGKTLSSEQKAHIKALVETWDMGANSFRALMEISNFLTATKNKTTFTTSLGLGSDGVNNGTAIASVLMGIKDDKLLNMVGIFGKLSEFKSYFDTRTDPSVGDYYTGLKPVLENAINKLAFKDNYLNNAKRAFEALNTNLKERKTLKAILIPFGYGAGTPRLIQSASEQMIKDIYATMEKIANMDKPYEKEQAFGNLQNNLQTILGNGFKLPEALLNFTFSDYQLKKLNDVYAKTIGTAIKSAMKTYASEFSDRRSFNIAIHTMAYDAYEIFKAKLEREAEDKRIKRVRAKYPDAKPNELERYLAYETLTPKERKEWIDNKLAKAFPTIASSYEHDEKHIGSIELAGTEKTLASDKSIDTVTTVYDSDKGGLINRNRNVLIRSIKAISTGVTANSQMIQGSDSGISSQAMTASDVISINVHDANIGNILHYMRMANEQNKAFFDVTHKYHIYYESLLGLVNTIESLDTLSTDEQQQLVHKWVKSLNRDGMFDLNEMIWQETELSVVLTEVTNMLIDKAIGYDLAKISLWQEQGVVHQYAGEGGEYTLTDADYKTLETQQAKLQQAKDKLKERMLEATANYQGKLGVIDGIHYGEDYGFKNTGKVSKRSFDISEVNLNEITDSVAYAFFVENLKLTDTSSKDQTKAKDTAEYLIENRSNWQELIDIAMGNSNTQKTLNIWFSTGENAQLSNLAYRPFTLDGKQYESVEHYYQTNKSGKFNQDVYAKNWKGGNKKISGGTEVDKSKNLIMMKQAMLESFKQNPQALEALLATGNTRLTHNQDTGVWRIDFPRLLMEVRNGLRGQGTNQTQDIYNNLPEKTVSSNVIIESVYGQNGVKRAREINGVFSLRTDGKHHFGNPFSSDKRLVERDGLTLTNSIKESVERYIDWVINSSDERAVWIRDTLKSGKLKGKPIIYYKELSEPSHANALDYLINQYDWGNEDTADNQDTLSKQSDIILANTKSATPYSTNLFKHLVSINPDLSVGIVTETTDEQRLADVGLKGGGVYYTDTNEAWFNLNDANWYATPLELVNHELIHSITYGVIQSGKYDERIEDMTNRIGNALVSGIIKDTDDGIIADRLMYAFNNKHELLTITLAEKQVRDSLPKHIITALNQLFTDVTGDFNATLSTTTRRDNQDDKAISSKNSGTEQSTKQSRADRTNQSSQNNQRDVGYHDTQQVQENPRTQVETGKVEIASIKVNDEVTHQVPTSFVDSVTRPTLDELKQVTSNILTKEQRKELSDILDYLHSVNPYVTFGFVKDNLGAVITKANKALKQKFLNETSGNTAWNSVSINLNTPTKDLDLFETVVHEYVHTATNKVELIGYDVKGNVIDYWHLKAIQDIVRAYAEHNNISDRRLDYFLGVNSPKGKEVNEVLTVGLTNPAVSSIIKNIKLDDGKSVHQFLQETLKNIVEYTQKLDNFPQEYTNDHVLEVRESDRRRREETLGDSERRARDTTNENQSRTSGKVSQRQRDRQQTTQSQKTVTYSLTSLEKSLNNLNSKAYKGLTDFVMDAVKRHNPNIQVVMSDKALQVNGNAVPASYATQINTITIYKPNFDTLSDDDKAMYINHELIHGLVEQSFSNPELKQYVDKLDNMIAELTAVWQDNQSNYTPSFNVRLSLMLTDHLSEFIAYGLTDPEMAKWINDNLSSHRVSAKRGFAEYIRQFLKNVYHAWFGGNPNKGFGEFVKVSQHLFSDHKAGSTVRLSQIINEANDIDVVSLFTSLPRGNVSSEHNAQLDSLINTFIGGYYKTTGNKSLVDLAQGKIKNKALLFGFKSSDKEAYVTEALVSVFNVYLANNAGTLAVNGINKLYSKAQAQFKTAKDLFLDYDKASNDEQARLRAIHQAVFNPKNKTADSLAWFMALAVSNEELGKALSSHVVKGERSNHSWFDKFMGMLEQVVNTFNNVFFNAKGRDAKAQIDTYVQALAKVETKARNGHVDYIQMGYSMAYGGLRRLADKPIRKGLVYAFNRETFIQSNFSPVRALGKIANVMKDADDLDKVGQLIKAIQPIKAKQLDKAEQLIQAEQQDTAEQLINEMVDRGHANFSPNNRMGLLADSINEIIGLGKRGLNVDSLIRMTKTIEQYRQSVKDNTYKAIRKQFTRELNKEEKSGITNILLRTDMASLLTHGFKPKDVLAMLDETKRKKMITDYENKLIDKVGHEDYDMLQQVYSLAYYMATGNSKPNMIKSAQGIAIGLGSDYQTTFDEMDSEIFEMVDVLSSLLALEFKDTKEIKAIQKLAESESKGLIATLNLHNQLIQKGRADFANNPYNYQKGYIPEIVNPYRKVVYATQDVVDNYKRKGFEIITELKQDDADDTAGRVLMIHPEYQPFNYVSGALDMVDTHHRGTPVYEKGVNDKGIRKVNKAHLTIRKVNAKQRPSVSSFDRTGNALIPTYDTQGVILDYHYEMGHSSRDTLLERDNSFDELLATLNGGLEFKPEMFKQQKKIAKAIAQDAKQNVAKRPNEYVQLDFSSKDPDVQRVIKMIPYSFRAELQKQFGKNAKSYPIHKSIYTATFGYQAYSVVNIWDKLDNNKKLNLAENLLRGMFDLAFKQNGRKRALQAERIIQDTMTFIKDMIVIRSGGVLLGNILSNTYLLMTLGINPVRILKDMTFSWRNSKNYRTAVNRIEEINALLMTTKSTTEKSLLNREKKQLQESLNRNPMKEYMEAGLMSTIVEDLTKPDETNYKTELQKKVDSYVDLIPKPISNTFNELTIGQGSMLHNFLSEATQFSDLSAKYTLAKYLQENGTSKDKAIYEAQLSFINYDIPTNQFLDYMNRMGLMMFTKFFLRFQRVMVKLAYNAPVSSLMGHYAVEYMGGQGVYDPFWLNRLGNPLESSVFNLPNAMSEVISANVLF